VYCGLITFEDATNSFAPWGISRLPVRDHTCAIIQPKEIPGFIGMTPDTHEVTMRRILLFMAVCSCASAGTPEEGVIGQRAVFHGDNGTVFGDRPSASATTIAAPMATVWWAAQRVFADFDIPVTLANPSTHQMGNPSFFKTRQLAGQPMEQLVDCGTSMAGPKAASYRIYMSFMVDIRADSAGQTAVKATFVPVGQDISGISSDRISCGTSGRLEAIFLDRVRATIGK
jgi:hypothetical protein